MCAPTVWINEELSEKGKTINFLEYQTYTFLFWVSYSFSALYFLSSPSDPQSKLDLRSLFVVLSFLLFRSMFNCRWPLLLYSIPSCYLIIWVSSFWWRKHAVNCWGLQRTGILAQPINEWPRLCSSIELYSSDFCLHQLQKLIC